MQNKLDLMLGMIPKNTASVIKVDKELAKLMLERNVMNRAISKPKMDQYRISMNNGDWSMTGDTIKFDNQNNLIDGQKRLMALIESNVNDVAFMICAGLDRNEVFTKIDRGQNRTAANDLEFLGVQNSTLISTMIKNITLFKKQSYGDRGGSSRVMTRKEMIDFHMEHKDLLQKRASTAGSFYKKSGCLVKPGIIASLYYMFAEKSEEAAKDFFDKFATGFNLDADSPILVLRNKIMKSKSNNKDRLTQAEIVKYMIIAWNKYRSGEKVKVLKIVPDAPIDIK